MKKSRLLLQKTTAVTLALLVALTTLVSFSLTAEAKGKKFVKSVKVAKKNVTLKKGKTTSVKVTVKGSKKANKKFKVKSNKKSVATAKVSGSKVVITGKSAGKATVTVTTKGKSKKGKALKAKIKVTVKGNSSAVKATPGNGSSSPASSNTPTPIRTLADKLEKISATASPSSITVGGTSRIIVKSETEGIAIDRTEFQSTNTTIATVDANGVVTGKTASNSPVIITVIAYDVKGNVASTTTSVTVIGSGSDDAKISEVPDNLVLGIGVTRKLNPVATNAGTNPSFVYTSDNNAVASVSSDGEIVTKSVGEARITVTIAGTTASAVCVVTVKDIALGISSFKATHAKILTINFTTTVSEADRDKLTIALKKGGALMDVKKEWSEDGDSVNLTTDAVFEATVYTVKISSDKISVDENNNTADCTVDKYEIKGVKITTPRIARANGVKIYFDVIDNYGDKIENANPGLFNWQFSCDDTKVRTTDIRYSTRNPDYIELTNFKAIENVEVDKTVIGVQAILKENAEIKSDRHNVSVVSLVIDKIDILDIETIDGAKYIYELNEDKPYKLVYDAVDNYGDPVDWSLYHPDSEDNAYNNTFQAHSDNEDVVSAPLILNNELIVYVRAGKSGSANVYAVAKDPNFKSYKINVLAAPKPQKIIFPDTKEHSLVAGEDEDYKIKVSFIDQYGEEMARGAVTEDDFDNKYFTINPSDKDLEVKYMTDNEGDFIVFNAKKLSSKVEKVNVIFTAFDDNDQPVISTFQAKIDEERRPDSIKFTDDIPSSIVVGETAEFKFKILDNRGADWTDPKGITVEMDADDIGAYVRLTSVDLGEDCNGVMKITGIKESTVNLDPHITLKFRLYYNGIEISSTTFTPPTVIVNSNLDDIKISTDIDKDSSIKSGQNVELTLTAYNNNKILDTYNHTYTKVTFREYDEDEGSSDNDKTQLVTVDFVNGVAKVNLEAQTAGNIIYTATIPVVGRDSITVVTAPAVKVNAGEVSKYDISVSNENELFTVVCYDKNNNIVKSYKPSDSTYIVLKDKNGTVLKTDDYINNVATKDGEVIPEFANGELRLSLKKSIPQGTEITVTTGAISKTITL